MSRRRQYRTRRVSSSEDQEAKNETEEDLSRKLEEAKELRNIRKRPSGVSAAGLAFGTKFTEEEKLAPDPFKLKTGGLVDLKDLSKEDIAGTEDEVVKRLASQFSAETQTRDDETHMLRYIEEEMAKQKGFKREERELSQYEAKIEELYKLPDKLKVKKQDQSEEMLSNQMLSGIPEVDLGLEAKFKNIEETESAKMSLLTEQFKKKEEKTSLVPTNMASNFTLHSLRFFKERERPMVKKKKEPETPQPAYIPVVGENDEPELKPTNTQDSTKKKVDHTQMPTDDFHYDKFKKRVRRF